jgi:hypothetical protein
MQTSAKLMEDPRSQSMDLLLEICMSSLLGSRSKDHGTLHSWRIRDIPNSSMISEQNQLSMSSRILKGDLNIATKVGI